MAMLIKQERYALDDRAKEIGTRLLQELTSARQKSGWSKSEVAREAGIDLKTLSRLEAGSGSVETLLVVMTALNFQVAGIARGGTLGEQLANARNKRKLTVEGVFAKTQLPTAKVVGLENGSGTIRDLFRLLAMIAPKVRGRAAERAYWGQGDKVDRDSRFTPAEFMAPIYDAFGPVDIDPCAHVMSPVIAAHRIMLAEGGDGLTDEWFGRLAFVNPPYSSQLDWLKRAHQQWSAGNVQTVLCLVPVRTDNRFFHETLHKDADLFLLKGRLRFSSVRGDVQHTPFSLWLVALGATAEQKARFAELVDGCWFRATAATPNKFGTIRRRVISWAYRRRSVLRRLTPTRGRLRIAR